MGKLFILLFIIFIINYFLLSVNEHYNDINNINLCDLHISNNLHEFNQATLTDIQKKCPTAATTTAAATAATAAAECPQHQYGRTTGLEKIINNNEGENTYTLKITDINQVVEYELTMTGPWGQNSINLFDFVWEWDANVVKKKYTDETDYPTFIDNTKLGGYYHKSQYGMNIIFISCRTLFIIGVNHEREYSLSVTEIDKYIPTISEPTTTTAATTTAATTTGATTTAATTTAAVPTTT